MGAERAPLPQASRPSFQTSVDLGSGLSNLGVLSLSPQSDQSEWSASLFICKPAAGLGSC